MPPRQAKKKPVDEEEDVVSEEVIDDSDASLASEGEEDDSPKAKGKAKAKPAPKRGATGAAAAAKPKAEKKGAGAGTPKKRKSVAGGEDDEEGDAKPKRARPRKVTGKEVDELGWTCVPPSLIYRDFGSPPSVKVAAFDADGTLITTKSGAEFPRDADDWRWVTPTRPTVLKDLHSQGYKIVIISNQGGIRTALLGKAAENSKRKFATLQKTLNIPLAVVMATGTDQYRKPGTGMWEVMCTEMNGGVTVDKSQSFFCGDAAGRPKDFIDKSTNQPSVVDKNFAAAVGVEFKLPEDVFGAPSADEKKKDEMVEIFKELSKHYFSLGDDGKWKGIAARNAASNLAMFEGELSMGNIKAVAAIKGVGKASLAVIKEFLETGKVAELEAVRGGGSGGGAPSPKAGAAGAAAKTEAAQVALQFM